MLGYARLVPGPGFELRRAALYYAQRLMPWPPLRRLVARAGGGDRAAPSV